MVTLGCARNEVDSEELAGRLAADGYRLVEDPEGADAVLVNTCGFIESAKKDSVDAILAATDSGAEVIAVGCMAERYGTEMAGALPEADAVLSFDDYPDIGARLDDVVAGRTHAPHTPRDRRKLLPISPVDRAAQVRPPGLPPLRQRLGGGPAAPLKLASGCDRRCTFCAIPSFRGAFVSRPADEIVAEAEWLAGHGVRELLLVSENTTSYGKDLGDLRALEKLLPRLAAVADRVRVSYLQPAELRPGLLEAIAGTPGVAPYFDLSFQHASGTLLRRMRRFGDRERFLALLARIRELSPEAGIRSNVIVGFPGETDAEFADLRAFVEQARLDSIGVFPYSDEQGTEAAGFTGKVAPEEIAARTDEMTVLAEEACERRALERVGDTVEVLAGEGTAWAAHQAPDVDGAVLVEGVRAGDLVKAEVTGAQGKNLEAVLI